MNPAPDVDALVQSIRELTSHSTELNTMIRSRSRDMAAMVQTPEGLKAAQDTADMMNVVYSELSRALAAMGPARAAVNRLLKVAKRTGVRA